MDPNPITELPPPAPAFSGSIVLKAKTSAEVQALAQQLDWYAVFEEPFHNKYDGGYACKGQVRAQPLDQPDSDQAVQILEQAAQIGALQEQVARLERERAQAAQQSAYSKKWLDLLTPEEHWRLVGRNVGVGERGIAVITPALGDEVLQQLARAMIDRAARHLVALAPDIPHVSQRAADTCAALLRELTPAITTTPEQAARQAEQAMEIAARFKEFFG